MMNYVINKIFMLRIQRRATTNHAEYGPILAHMKPLFAENGPKTGPMSAPGATAGCPTALSADCTADSPPNGDFYAFWWANGWRCSFFSSTHVELPSYGLCGPVILRAARSSVGAETGPLERIRPTEHVSVGSFFF